MGRLGRLAGLVILVLVGALCFPREAVGHALLQSSDPEAGATLASPPSEVLLTFSEPPDLRLSSIKVLDSTGADHATGPLQAGEQRTQLKIAVGSLSDGTYTVSWRTVSTADGHTSVGSFVFGVGQAPVQASADGGGGAGTSSSASLQATVSRWLLYIGLLALLGAAFVAVAIEPSPSRAVIVFAAAGWLAAAAGTLGVIGAQWADAGADFAAVIGSSIGIGGLERIVSITLAGLIVALLVARRHAIPRWWFGMAAATAAAAMLVDVLTGHASAGSLALLDVTAQWLHGVAAGIWIGGLAATLLIIGAAAGPERAGAIKRFSGWAGYAIALVAGTGVLRAVSEVGSFSSLFGTDFGLVVIAKSVLLGVLAVLGATNRWVTVPRAIHSIRWLRRLGSTEVAIGTVVLALTALLVNLPPPSSAGAAAAPPKTTVVASGNDFGTTTRLRLVVTPGTPGQNEFALSATDYDSGEPATASKVSIRFELASRRGVAPSTLPLSASAPGAFRASAGNLSIDGIWQLTATISGPGGAVEVPLALATAVPAQHVELNATPGAPTIATLHLDDGGSAQLYLDPGSAGDNELHVTFFDEAGSELPVRSATFLVASPDVPASIIPARRLEPGHFVADVTAPAGDVVIDVVGQDPAGGQLHLHLKLQVSA